MTPLLFTIRPALNYERRSGGVFLRLVAEALGPLKFEARTNVHAYSSLTGEAIDDNHTVLSRDHFVTTADHECGDDEPEH